MTSSSFLETKDQWNKKSVVHYPMTGVDVFQILRSEKLVEATVGRSTNAYLFN